MVVIYVKWLTFFRRKPTNLAFSFLLFEEEAVHLFGDPVVAAKVFISAVVLIRFSTDFFKLLGVGLIPPYRVSNFAFTTLGVPPILAAFIWSKEG